MDASSKSSRTAKPKTPAKQAKEKAAKDEIPFLKKYFGIVPELYPERWMTMGYMAMP